VQSTAHASVHRWKTRPWIPGSHLTRVDNTAADPSPLPAARTGNCAVTHASSFAIQDGEHASGEGMVPPVLTWGLLVQVSAMSASHCGEMSLWAGAAAAAM
jgi:hypothetical protein